MINEENVISGIKSIWLILQQYLPTIGKVPSVEFDLNYNLNRQSQCDYKKKSFGWCKINFKAFAENPKIISWL